MTPGRPVTFVVTQNFLDHFGLESARDLPGLKELRAAGLLDNRPPPGTEEQDEDDDAQDELFDECPHAAIAAERWRPRSGFASQGPMSGGPMGQYSQDWPICCPDRGAFIQKWSLKRPNRPNPARIPCQKQG
jgi:hypothetical protein